MPTGQLWRCFPREENCTKIDPPEGAKPARGGSKMASGRPPGGSVVPVGPLGSRVWAALGRSWDACGALGAVLGASWGVPGRSWAPLGGHVGTPQGLIWTIWALSVAQREIQQKHRILRCFRASRASRRAPKALQNRPKMSLGRLVGPKVGLEGPRKGT